MERRLHSEENQEAVRQSATGACGGNAKGPAWTNEGRQEILLHLHVHGATRASRHRGRAGAKDKPFTHAFSPHCLRHTFAIQHINVGTDVKLISKWLGHESVAVTLEHYGNW